MAAIDQIGLDAKFFSKNLYYNAAFTIQSCFKYYTSGLMQHKISLG